MAAYHDAIKRNAAVHFKGKVVLDVGSGTGVLAIWAAQAGARRVYAVEASGVGAHIQTMVEAHGLADTVTVLRERVEQVELAEQAREGSRVSRAGGTPQRGRCKFNHSGRG